MHRELSEDRWVEQRLEHEAMEFALQIGLAGGGVPEPEPDRVTADVMLCPLTSGTPYRRAYLSANRQNAGHQIASLKTQIQPKLQGSAPVTAL